MELSPPDPELLAASSDPNTGFEHIPTGATPYHLLFRRLVQRLGLAAARSNDLRVYQADDLAIGVYPGHCFIGDQPFEIADPAPLTLDPSTTTHLWIDQAGAIQTSTSAFPTDRSDHLRLASVTTDSQAITTLLDLRGESLYQSPSAALLGLTATPQEINQALDGLDPGVTATHLNALTAGNTSTVDALHRHLATNTTVDGRSDITFANFSVDPAASVALSFALPFLQSGATRLQLAPDHTYLQQATPNDTFTLVGSAHLAHTHAGTLTVSETGLQLGPVPIDANIVDVILSVATNTQSAAATDGVAATVYVNGNSLTSTPASLIDNDGTGFRCTDTQGPADGTPASLNPSAVPVQRGDLLTLDLTLTNTGPASQLPVDPTVLVVLRPNKPE